MPIEIVTVFIAMVSGVLGYLFREYTTKVKPFFQILTIDGNLSRNDDEVSINPTITPRLMTELKDTFYLPKLDAEFKYSIINAMRTNIEKLQRFSPEVMLKIDKVLVSNTDYEFVNTLGELFQTPFFDECMFQALYRDKLDLPELSQNLEEKIQIYDDERAEGSIVIKFPRNSVGFGYHLNTPFIRAKYDVLAKGVQCLDRPFLEKILKNFKNLLEREYHIADGIFIEVKEIEDKHSRWGFCSYIANLNSYPLIIEPDATLFIMDKKTGKFSEACELAIVDVSEAGELRLTYPARRPIVLKPTSGLELGFISKKNQGSMELGAEIRASFNRKQAECQIEICVRQVGLFKRRKYKSPKTRFVEIRI